MTIPLGTKNKLAPAQSVSPPTQFVSGTVASAFTVTTTKNVTWTVTSPDGVVRQVTASTKSPVCG